MPPTSVNIFEEGAEIVSFKIVSEGKFDRDELWELMVERPGRYEGGSGCRNFKDVESDLKAVSCPKWKMRSNLMVLQRRGIHIANRCKS